MAVGEIHPPVTRVWTEYTPRGEALMWECSDPDCVGGSTFVADLRDLRSDRYSHEASRLLEDGRCPHDHYLKIF